MSGRAEEATQAAIRAALQHYPSLRTEVLTFLGDRLSEALSGEVAPVAVNVFGPDLDELDRVADEIAAVARTVPGASDVQVQAPSGAPFLRVDLRPEQLGQYGFTAADVLDTVETAYQGTTAAQVYDANKVIDLTVRLPPAERVDPEAIGQLLVRTANGVTVPLTGAPLSIGSLVGVVTQFGIVARNAILLIAHLGHLLAVEGAQWSLPTVLRSTRERLVPILMTALVTALGLLPLALGSGEAGREVQGPMASVILGGLATSTLMTLVVLPILIWRFGPLARADATGAR